MTSNVREVANNKVLLCGRPARCIVGRSHCGGLHVLPPVTVCSSCILWCPRSQPAVMLPAARCCWRLLSAPSFARCRLEFSAVRYLRTSGTLNNDALPSPALDDGPKVYHPKIQQLVDQIASLTLLEVSDLNELLKKTLNIQDVGMMPMGAMMPGVFGAAAPAQAAEEDDAPVKEKTHFTVKLTEVNATDKIKLIKEVKNCVQGVNLVQAKKMVESLPQEIKVNVAKEEAEKMKAALEAAGGTVVIE